MQWKVIRGDTATLEVKFLENDEITPIDTSDWTFMATTYDPQGNVLDNLGVSSTEGSVLITADSCLTEKWGIGYKSVVAELSFDLSVRIEQGPINAIVWTPVIGTISVLGDVTPGGSL